MAQIPLQVVPPEEPDIVALRVFESSTPDGSFVQIDRITSIGTYPAYLDRYVTNNATLADDWFSIAWERVDGTVGELSAAVKGNTRTLVGEIVDRILLRQSTADETIVVQEVEAAIEWIFNVNPYSLTIDDVTYVELNALTDLARAATGMEILMQSAVSGSSSYTVGLVQEQSSTSTGANLKNSFDSLERLEKRALRRLGKGGSLIAQMKAAFVTPTLTQTNIDSSRLLATVVGIEVEEII